MSPKKSRELRIVTAFTLIVLISGLNFVAVRFSNRELAPFWGASIRFGLASLLLFVVVFIKHLPLPKGRALVGALLYGLLGFGASYAFAYLALSKITAGLASVIMSLVPLFTFVLAFLHGLEPFRWRTLIGALFAIAGAALLFQNQFTLHAPLSYVLLMFGAAISAAETGVVVKWFPKSHPVVTNALGMATGALLLFVLAAVTHQQLLVPQAASTWAALVYLISIGSIGLFMLYIFVLSRWTASATSYMFVLSPFVAIPIGAWLAQETISATFLLSSALVLSGVYIGAIAPIKKSSKP